MATRIDWDRYFLDIAWNVSSRATCLRAKHGAVLVDTGNRIVSTGYNGAPRGYVDCLQRHRCVRQEKNIPSGSNYEMCYSVHAEMNALLQAGLRAEGCRLYLGSYDAEMNHVCVLPCLLCAKMLVNSEVDKVIMWDGETKQLVMNPQEILEQRLTEAHLPVFFGVVRRG